MFYNNFRSCGEQAVLYRYSLMYDINAFALVFMSTSDLYEQASSKMSI